MNSGLLQVGVAGLGFMGAMHLSKWRLISAVKIAAVMSSDPVKLQGDLSGIGGNLGTLENRFDFTGTARYTTFDDLIADPTLDIVDICLPTHLHAAAAIQALQAGKHVFLEKPMALDAAAAERVLTAAQASGRTLMTGQVLRFIPEYKAVAERLPSLSSVKMALFRRRCAAPAWSTWLTDPGKSGGAILDLLIHDLDYCISLWGMPSSVRCTGHADYSNGIDVSNIELHYPGLGPILVTGGWHHPKSYPFAMEFTVVTPEATFEWENNQPLMQYRNTGDEVAVQMEHDEEQADFFRAELSYFAECIRHGVQPERCPPKESAQAVLLAELAHISRAQGGTVISCNSA